jgi:transposase
MACFEKQRQINHLLRENEQLKAKVRSLERTTKEGLFGSATPSSKIPVKANTLSERQARQGGAQPGHVGHGRGRVHEAQADRVEAVAVEAQSCPDCGVALCSEGVRERTVIDMRPAQTAKVLYRLERRVCPQCGRRFGAKAPATLPQSLYTNAFLSHVAEQHCLWGTPPGRIEQQTGVGVGALIEGQKRLARLPAPAVEKPTAEYRRCPVKHADETGRRTDGRNGYAWLFATVAISLFRFRQSRSAAVAAEVLGKRRLPGVLVVDRYSAYNKAPVALQYCLAHLKRDVDDLAEQFPGAERDLRPLVIARKVSFGSQSQAGALTRETLMTILHTLKKRRSASGVASALKAALDRLAVDPSLDPWTLLLGPDSPQPDSADQD